MDRVNVLLAIILLLDVSSLKGQDTYADRTKRMSQNDENDNWQTDFQNSTSVDKITQSKSETTNSSATKEQDAGQPSDENLLDDLKMIQDMQRGDQNSTSGDEITAQSKSETTNSSATKEQDEEQRADENLLKMNHGMTGHEHDIIYEAATYENRNGRICPDGQIFDEESCACKVLDIVPKLLCTSDVLNRTWQEILRTDNNGNPLSGAKADLLEAARKGSRIKIRTSTYSAEVQNCRLINQDICCQALLHGSYSSWENFQSNVYWWMINVCTTGNWHIVRYFVGGGYLSQTKTRGSFNWYVYRNIDGTYPDPLLSTDSSGVVVSGIRNRVKRAIKNGESLSVFLVNLVVLPLQKLQINPNTVSAQHVWSVSQGIVGDHVEFQSNAYWYFNLLTNFGSFDVSRWRLGSHTEVAQSNSVAAMDWFPGSCWFKAFKTKAKLSQEQSRLFLKSKVEAGLPIKVRFGNIYREVDNVMLSGNHTSAQIIPQLAREDDDTFVSDLNWEFSTVSTRGKVRTYRPLVGSSTMATLGKTITSEDITWYFDTRNWDLMFHISDNGTTISGSALAVRNAVEQGADVRVGYRQAGDPGFRFATGDNINFGPSPDLSVQVMRHLRDNAISGDEFDFGDNLVWSFLLLNTKGFIRKTDWVVGEHVNDGRSTERAEIKFFVNL